MLGKSDDDKTVFYFKIILAGIKIEVECRNRRDFAFCKNYLSAFDSADFIVKASSDEIEKAEKELADRFNIADFSAKEIRGIENQIIYRKIVEQSIKFNTVLVHGAVVAKDGNGYMFTAPSGVGKTTRTRIFQGIYPDAIVVNGDKPLIKITSAQAIACGTPWCGKEGWNTNIMVPLRAIFLLERVEKGEISSIEEISLGKAFPFLLQQTYHADDPDLMRKTLQLLKSLEGKVKIYRFRSTPSAESVRLAYETAKPQ